MPQLCATNNGFPYPASIYADVMYAVITGALVQRKKWTKFIIFEGVRLFTRLEFHLNEGMIKTLLYSSSAGPPPSLLFRIPTTTPGLT